MTYKKLLIIGCVAVIGPVGSASAGSASAGSASAFYCCWGPNQDCFNGSCKAQSEESCKAKGGKGSGNCSSESQSCWNDLKGESF
ncbi:MAG: hypothetical protein B7Y25_01155 [Alphaproteobacteria bacterium 16-39-46]|nr:MAG: hypothetical protein B7Y25_01155 [Alphaproteobacteria bacterium 16-39-46]OZA44150.1 MAG: hypothetical protein B7X84_01325 [Alphaproteobacteria bacterium 17-39-52]HQS83507.1 hypothetical protein [Alphaproteobacteria bacterium]HQS93275.1 hypothetical protein [Alphaproteobacteria bacterium]